MKHLLRKGQVFRSPKFKDLVCTLDCEYSDKGMRYNVDHIKLKFDISNNATVYRAECKDGWERKYQDVIDLAIHDDDIVNQDFVVVEVAMQGGNIGHGRGDEYPDGHHIVAKEVNGDREVSFYQTGCFIGMLDPKDIDLVSGPADERAQLKIVWVEK